VSVAFQIWLLLVRGDDGQFDVLSCSAPGVRSSSAHLEQAATAVSLIFTCVPPPGCGSGLFGGGRVKIEMDRIGFVDKGNGHRKLMLLLAVKRR
jgi:hypothetical protein